MVRYSLKFVPWEDQRIVATDLKTIYTAPNADSAAQALAAFKEKWGKKYSTISDSWERNWQDIVPFLAFPDYIRKAIYTTNTIEAIPLRQ
jgi:putative transposase